MPLELVSGIPPGVPATPRNAVLWVDTPAGLQTISQELQIAEVVGLDVEPPSISARCA